jgi:hypothetical protein
VKEQYSDSTSDGLFLRLNRGNLTELVERDNRDEETTTIELFQE